MSEIVLADLIDRDDVRVIKCRNDLRFLPESKAAFLISGKFIGQKLYGDIAVEFDPMLPRPASRGRVPDISL